jgi:adenylate kinase family enzyme
MPLLTPDDPVPGRPRRVLVAGASGSGKTTLAATIAQRLGVPHTEIDALFHGPAWTPRPAFADDVARVVAEPAWVTEWQYRQVRELLAARAQLLVWVDLSRGRVMEQVVRRTLRRRWNRQVLWNGNVEPPLRTLFTDPEHIVRWAWSTHRASRERVLDLLHERPDLDVVRLPDRSAVRRWVAGPLTRAAGAAGPS